jgi:tRNA-dihydrouridine synthase B
MIRIGPYSIRGRAVLAPMAGVTDLPFRRLCARLGAALTPGEMISADPQLWNSTKSRLRRQQSAGTLPTVVQIAGSDARTMAEAAQRNVDAGAQIIDINMGCPAKKVCRKAAGSALLKDESLVGSILRATVRAANVPVTLKIRTGWSPARRNGVMIARIAEDSGVQALAVHGRTRACRFGGDAEYQTIAAIKQAVGIPVFANGDIDSPAKALRVIATTGADGVMIGRAAQGKPWIFREVDAALRGNPLPASPLPDEVSDIMLAHLRDLYVFYGEQSGVRIARKHIGWYCRGRQRAQSFRSSVMQAATAEAQLAMVREYFASVADSQAVAA